MDIQSYHPGMPTRAFDALNEAQREAATFGGGPLLIVAGAGTGKTNTLAHRVAHLVLKGASPQRILLLTFTRRAALEMTRRARRIVGEVLGEARFPWSGTFHSVANRILRQHAARLGLDPGFSVLDRGDAADLIDLVRHELGLSRTEKRFPRKDTCLAIYSHRVNTGTALRHTLDAVFPWCAQWEEELTSLFRGYVERKLASHALDYDDLLLYWDVTMADPALARQIGASFDHVLVDEYQDTNPLQARILKALRPDGAGVTVVGDDAQAIYSFRAATVENILGFPAQYAPPATTLTLEQNYRSTQGVLDAANALIAAGERQYRKTLRSSCGGGRLPRYATVRDDEAQASYVVTHVLEARERGMLLKRQAVLFRSSHHSDLLELELARRNIPYVKYGGLKFLEAAHVKDLLSILRWADNPKNRISAFRALQLQPGIGPALAARIFARFEAGAYQWSTLQTHSPGFDSLMRSLARPEEPWAGQMQRVRQWFEPELERRYDAARVRAGDLQQLETIAQQFATREQFLSELALDPPQATGDLAGPPLLDEDYLILSTVHSAKGQEWDAVYVLNVADGNFPSDFATGRAELIEEERRLLYVAMTRAKTDLHLIAPLKYYVAQQSRTGDRHVYGATSRFLTPAVLACLERISWPAGGVAEAVRTPAASSVDVAGRLREMWS